MQYKNYNIEWSSPVLQVNISFINVETEIKYETIIHEQDIKIGSTKKLITMLKNCINSIQDYSIELEEQENNLIAKLNYNSDLLDLQEIIILQKLSISQIDTLINQNTKLKKRIEQLENKLSQYENIPNILDFMDYSDIIKYGNITLLEYLKNRGIQCVGSGQEFQSLLYNIKPNSLQALQWLLDNNFNFLITDFLSLINLTGWTNNTNSEEEIIIEVLQWFKNNFSSVKESDSNQKISGELFKSHKKYRVKLLTWLCESTNLVDYSSIISTGNIQLLNLLKSKGVEFNTRELQTLINSNTPCENILEVIQWLSSEKYFSNHKYSGTEYQTIIQNNKLDSISILNILHQNGYNFTQYHTHTILSCINTRATNSDYDVEIIKILNWLKEKIPDIFNDNYPQPCGCIMEIKFTSIFQWVEKNHPKFKQDPCFTNLLHYTYQRNMPNLQERFLWIKNTYGLNTVNIPKNVEKIDLTNWLKSNGFTVNYT
jgi:hypothetical protein